MMTFSIADEPAFINIIAGMILAAFD